MRKKLMLVFLFSILATGAYAVTGDLAAIGTGAKSTMQDFIKSWDWVFALLAFGVPAVVMGWTWNKVSEKEENAAGGQSEPKYLKIFKTVAAGMAGLVAVYVIYGGFAVMFIGANFTDGWSIFVTDFFRNVFLQ